MLKIPYGQSNFKLLIEDGFFYQDRTDYIQSLESFDSRFVVYLRPRRFGKSLFVSMLKYYYALEHQSDFNALFGNLAIGRSPTPLANTYMTLFFEFSGIQTNTSDSTYNGFHNAVLGSVRKFLEAYTSFFAHEQKAAILNQNAPNEILRQLFNFHEINKVPHPIYILIDEYDHFANELISFNFSLFSEIVSKNGFVRKFYETIKTATGAATVQRLFITGVSPITLDSLTSGFNIASGITLDRGFHNMMGFDEEEVTRILSKIGVTDDRLTDVINDLRSWYDGYLFNPKARHVYNPDMVLYFAQKYQKEQEYPSELLDPNIATDYSKIRNLFKIQDKEEFNFDVLDALSQTGAVKSELTAQFSFEKEFEKGDLISLLFYMGFLTIQSEDLGVYTFKFPNFVIEKLYAGYFVRMLQQKAGLPIEHNPINQAVVLLAQTGNPQPFFDVVANILKTLSNRDAMTFNEVSLKSIFVSLLHQQKFYYIHSEYESGLRYVDIFLEAIRGYNPAFEVAFELKHIKKNNNKVSVKNTLQSAETQLQAYIQTRKFIPRRGLKSFAVVVKGEIIHWKECQMQP